MIIGNEPISGLSWREEWGIPEAPAPAEPCHVTPAGYDVMKCVMGTCDHDAPAEGAEQVTEEWREAYYKNHSAAHVDEELFECLMLDSFAATLRDNVRLLSEQNKHMAGELARLSNDAASLREQLAQAQRRIAELEQK